MELWEFENIVLEWCGKNGYYLREVKLIDNSVEIHRYYTISQNYGIKKDILECYHCYLNDDMTFKNVPHGMKGRVKNKKLIIKEEE